MNGRVYDPLVSRFLSPDLFVQAPGNSQSFNRYAYVFNNPLSYTDPSGYIGIPQQWSESPVQEVDNSWFWVNHNLGNHGFGGGSGSSSSFGNSQTGYGLPGFGGNGTGVNGIYYDWVSGAYRYVSNPGRVVIGGFWLDVPLSEKVNEGLNGKLPGRWIIGGGIRSIYINQGLGVGDDPQGGGGELGGRDWVDNTQIGVESFGLANSSKEQLIKLAAKSDGSINNLKYVKGVKVVGKVAVVGSVALTGYQTYNDIQNGNYYSAATRATVLGIGLAATAIPVAGWFVAGGIGLADAIWGDQFYNWVELNLRNEP